MQGNNDFLFIRSYIIFKSFAKLWGTKSYIIIFFFLGEKDFLLVDWELLILIGLV